MGYAATLKKVQEQEDEHQHTGCRAHGCKFPAGLSAGGGAPGFCRHHEGVNPIKWPGITDAMTRDHAPLLSEVLSARRYFGANLPGNDSDRMADAWSRLRAHGYDMDPANCVQRSGGRRPAGSYRIWAYAAEDLLAKLVRAAQ